MELISIYDTSTAPQKILELIVDEICPRSQNAVGCDFFLVSADLDFGSSFSFLRANSGNTKIDDDRSRYR
jgi:hypothetical protein